MSCHHAPGPCDTTETRLSVAHNELPQAQLPGRAILVSSGAKEVRGLRARGAFSDVT